MLEVEKEHFLLKNIYYSREQFLTDPINDLVLFPNSPELELL